MKKLRLKIYLVVLFFKDIWYLIKVTRPCEQLGLVSIHIFTSEKRIKFCSQNFGNSREDKNGPR